MSFYDRLRQIEEAGRSAEPLKPAFARVFKFNPYHDEHGRFSSSDERAGESYGAEAKGHAARVMAQAAEVEKNLSPVLKSVVGKDGHFQGWHNRLKAETSLERKIYKDAKYQRISLKDAANHIGDAVRYTVTTTADKYKQVVHETMKALNDKGYVVAPGKFKNYWAPEGGKSGDTPIYQGINVNLVAPNGVKWELQFHTNQSFKTKSQLNHDYYAEYRKIPGTDKDAVGVKLSPAMAQRKQALSSIMRENQSRVRVPPGASRIKWPWREKA